jgi:hypothetical protein
MAPSRLCIIRIYSIPLGALYIRIILGQEDSRNKPGILFLIWGNKTELIINHRILDLRDRPTTGGKAHPPRLTKALLDKPVIVLVDEFSQFDV